MATVMAMLKTTLFDLKDGCSDHDIEDPNIKPTVMVSCRALL